MNFKIAISLLVLFSLVVTIAQPTITLTLSKGKNNVTVDSFFYPVYVSSFVRENPSVQSVTLHDYGRSFGYVNTMGGIGKNFLLEQGKTYEIHVNQTVNVTLR